MDKRQNQNSNSDGVAPMDFVQMVQVHKGFARKGFSRRGFVHMDFGHRDVARKGFAHMDFDHRDFVHMGWIDLEPAPQHPMGYQLDSQKQHMVADNSDKESSAAIGNFDMELFAHRVASNYTAAEPHTESGNQAAFGKEVGIDTHLASVSGA